MYIGRFIKGRSRVIPVILVIFLLSVALLATVSAQGTSEEYTVGVQRIADGMTSPVMLVPSVDDSGRLFVVDQAGFIWIVSSDGQRMEQPFLDVRDQLVEFREGYDERGLLGLAFHPDYANNGLFYVYYTAPLRPEAPDDWDHTNVVAEYQVSADNPDQADTSTQRIIFQLDHPSFNHDAGHIRFGPDGYLYIPMGDGGGANDTGTGHTPDIGNGQDISNLYGAILRIDVNTTEGDLAYGIPDDNPFVGNDAGADEIYAYGFRNPYDISFDRDGRLYAADVGQNLYEEVDIVELGGNYGWNIKEATHCFDPDNPNTPPEECPDTGPNGEPLIAPVIEYSHDYGIAIVGGNMYHGTTLSNFTDHFIFADYLGGENADSGVLFWAEPSGDGSLWPWGEIQVAGMDNNRIGEYILGIGQDNNGEFYVMTTENSGPTGNTGKLWKLVPADMTQMGDSGMAEATPETTPEASG